MIIIANNKDAETIVELNKNFGINKDKTVVENTYYICEPSDNKNVMISMSVDIDFDDNQDNMLNKLLRECTGKNDLKSSKELININGYDYYIDTYTEGVKNKHQRFFVTLTYQIPKEYKNHKQYLCIHYKLFDETDYNTIINKYSFSDIKVK